MVLYRFPLLFSSKGDIPSWRKRIKYFLRPYRGLGARFRDAIISSLQRTRAGCSQWPEENHIVLLLGFMPTFYRDVLRPVAESLSKSEVGIVVISDGYNSSPNFPSTEKIIFQSLWEHWNKDVRDLSRAMYSRLGMLQKIFYDLPSLNILSKDFGNQIDLSALAKELSWLFCREFPRLILQTAVARHILDSHHPALIISADDADQRCRIYSLLAGRMNIPALLVQQGLASREYPEWIFFSQTAVAVMGEKSRDALMAQGVPNERIILTGHPGFDHLALPEPDLCNCLRAELGAREEMKMVLFASQPYYVGVFNSPRIREIMIEAIAQACGTLKNVRLIVKPHPGDNIRELKMLLKKAPSSLIVERTRDISPLIKACDVLITFFSTAALQALYAAKPVINVDFPDSGGQSLYSESGATWIARSAEEIIRHIRNLTGESRNREMSSREAARKHFLYYMVYHPDGRATERVLRAIFNILRTKRI
jgi:hypothetical protein